MDGRKNTTMTKTNKEIEAIIDDLKQLFDEYGIDYEKFGFSIGISKETINPYIAEKDFVVAFQDEKWWFKIIRNPHPTPPSQLSE